MAGVTPPAAPGAPRPPAGPGKLSTRSDMAQGTQGQYTDPGLPYGTATAIRQGLSAAPIPKANMFAPGGAQPSPPGLPATPGMANNSAPPLPGPPPGVPGIHQLMNVPTRNPQEPVTAGLPIGAGPGPTPTPSPTGTVLAYLASTYFATDAVKNLALQVDRPNMAY